MKTYTVYLNGQQKHIESKVYENQRKSDVLLIIDKYSDGLIPFDGEPHEVNSEYTMRIVEEQ